MTVKATNKRAVKQKLFPVFTSLALMAASMQPTFAAIEIDETDFGPSYETMVVDTIVGKPLQQFMHYSRLFGT